MCQICGQPEYLRCECESQQPYCDNCASDSKCVTKMDSECVIYHLAGDKPSKLENLQLGNGVTAEKIFETIDDLIGTAFNIKFEPVDTKSIKWTAGGQAGHKPKADVAVSQAPGNQVEIRDDGFFAPAFNPDFKVKVDEDDNPDYLENQITGDTDGCVSVSVQKRAGILYIKPTIDIACLLQNIQENHLAEFCEMIDKCNCFLDLQNLIATFAPACPTGYTLNGAGTLCEDEQTTAPTIAGTIVSACPAFYTQYAQYGALVYTGGFTAGGEGTGANLPADITSGAVVAMVNPEVWQNNTAGGDNIGPMNRAGVWRCAGTGGSLGFVVPINVPVTKTYYIAIAADDEFQLQVDGATIVDSALASGGVTYWNADGGAKYRYWHIYPVNLTAGIRYVSLVGVDTGGVASALAAEIYDATLAQLQAATLDPAFLANRATYPLTSNHYNNLNLVFSTRCARQPGSTFTVGNATCPDSSWTLDTTGGAPLVSPCQGINSNTASWICRKTVTSPFAGYTATLVWDRIPTANTYTVEQKLSSDPDSAYVQSAGSPVANPGSGTTVSLVISGLPSDQMTFRVRANFDTCSTEWTVIVPS